MDRGENWMQQPRQEHAQSGQKQVIVPASAQRVDGAGGTKLSGYAIHTGEARSTEDVTVRGGKAPIIERGEADDDEIEETLSEIDASSGGAPD
jgi:hypothetical protein